MLMMISLMKQNSQLWRSQRFDPFLSKNSSFLILFIKCSRWKMFRKCSSWIQTSHTEQHRYLNWAEAKCSVRISFFPDICIFPLKNESIIKLSNLQKDDIHHCLSIIQNFKAWHMVRDLNYSSPSSNSCVYHSVSPIPSPLSLSRRSQVLSVEPVHHPKCPVLYRTVHCLLGSSYRGVGDRAPVIRSWSFPSYSGQN